MISVKQLLYKLDLKLNKLATNQHQYISDEDKIFVLNEAQIKLIKSKVGINNIYQLGLDSFTKRYHDLENLIPPVEKINNLTHKIDTYDYYSIDISKLDHKLMFLISTTGVCTKNGCADRPVVATKVAKHADLDMLMDNTNYTPSFEYQETLVTISDNKIKIYTDKTFEVDYAYITYLRYPKKIDIEGYIDLDGNTTITQDCELADYLEDELLELAKLEIATNTENISSMQSAEQRIKTNE